MTDGSRPVVPSKGERVMLYAVPIQCPCCGKWVDNLCFAHKVDDIHFHVCEDCIGTITSLATALRVGYHTGFKAGVDKAIDTLQKQFPK